MPGDLMMMAKKSPGKAKKMAKKVMTKGKMAMKKFEASRMDKMADKKGMKMMKKGKK